MRTAFVTGATGFIGRHFAAELSRLGIQVKCWLRETSRVDHLDNLDAEIIRGDFLTASGWRRRSPVSAN